MKKRRDNVIVNTKDGIVLDQQEEKEFDDALNKIHQPNRTTFHLSEFPQIIQDMVNGVYRDDVRIDPFRPRPKRKK